MVLNPLKSPLVKIGFEPDRVTIPLEKITSHRTISELTRNSRKYAQISNSVAKLGIIEPLVVSRLPNGGFRLLDGLLRLDICRLSGGTEIDCIIARDDEAFTYNRRVNHLPIIQEHRMIQKAIDRGLSPEQVADALNIDVTTVRQRRRLLDRICPEVVEMLKERHVAASLFGILKRMVPTRQIEAVELMIAVDRVSVPYARALLAATPASELDDKDAKKSLPREARRKVELMQREVGNLEREYKDAEKSYGRVNMELVLAKGYMRRVMDCVDILQLLIDNHRDLLTELRLVCERGKNI